MPPEEDRRLVWLHGSIKTPPFSKEARTESGFLLRRLQVGEKVGLPHLRPMPSIASRCHELRINDANATWRIIYRLDADVIIILAVFAKQTLQTPKTVIDACQKRLRTYDE